MSKQPEQSAVYPRIVEYMELPSIDRNRIGKNDANVVVEIAPNIIHRIIIPAEEMSDQRVSEEIKPYLERRKKWIGKTVSLK